MEGAGAGRLVLVAEARSNATVVLTFEGSAVLAGNVEIVLGDGASLTVVLGAGLGRRRGPPPAASTRSVGRDASLRHVAVSFGGDLVRAQRLGVVPTDPGGEAELLGLLLRPTPGSASSAGCTSTATRRRPAATSTTRARCRARAPHAVWIGDVLIRKVAEGVETLRVQPQPRAHRRLPGRLGTPNLEIETGEMRRRRAQASTTGQLRRPAAVLPAGRGASPRTRRGAWSCTASSPTSSARSACHDRAPAEERSASEKNGRTGRMLGSLHLPPRPASASHASAAAGGVAPGSRHPGRRRGQRRGRRARDERRLVRRRRRVCSHREHPAVCEGEVAGCEIECWLHGSRFDLRAGKPDQAQPATEPVAIFPVKVRG